MVGVRGRVTEGRVGTPATLLALARATHLGPTVAVSLVAVLLAVAAAVGVEGQVTGYVVAFIAAAAVAGIFTVFLLLRCTAT